MNEIVGIEVAMLDAGVASNATCPVCQGPIKEEDGYIVSIRLPSLEPITMHEDGCYLYLLDALVQFNSIRPQMKGEQRPQRLN